MNIYQPVISGSLTVTGSTTFIGNITINSGSLTMTSGSLTGTASFSTSASYAYTASSATSASYVLNAVSSSYAFTASSATNSTSASKAVSSSYSDTASFSNNFTVLGNLTVYGTQSVQYITSSQLNVANNIINVNVGTPGVRFGGLSVFDSGSTAGATGSLFWDSQNNNWVYQQVTGSTYTGGMLISGPRNFAGLGNEQGTTSGSLMKGQGGDHMTSSAIFEDGYKATFYTNSLVVSSSGNVGIGTNNPTASSGYTVLSINNATNGGLLDLQGGGTSYGQVYAYNAGGLNIDAMGARPTIFHNNNAETVRITSGGNIGIGSTNPSQRVEIQAPANYWATRFIGANVASQSYGFYVDAGTNATDTCAMFRSNGGNSTYLYIGGDGKVGVGETPTSLIGWSRILTLNGNNLGDSAYILKKVGSAQEIAIGTDGAAAYFDIAGNATGTNNNIIFRTAVGNSSYSVGEKMRISSAGNVGIGITNPDANLVIGNLNTPGKGSINGASGTINRAIINCPYPGAAALTLAYYSSAYGLDIWVNGDGTGLAPVYIDQRNTEAIIFRRSTQSTAVESMRITGGGYVGIGHTSPACALDIGGTESTTIRAGSWAIMENVTTNQAMFGRNVTYNSIGGSGWRSINTGYATGIRMNDDFGDGSIVFYTNPSTTGGTALTNWDTSGPKFIVRNGGNVGIGSTNPQYKLDVAGTAYASGAAGALSDIRHKNNIVATTKGLAELMRLKPVEFEWNEVRDNGMRGTQLGFIAQDIQEILPSVVLEIDNEEKTLGLKSSELLAVAIKAIQEQQAQIEELKTLINK